VKLNLVCDFRVETPSLKRSIGLWISSFRNRHVEIAGCDAQQEAISIIGGCLRRRELGQMTTLDSITEFHPYHAPSENVDH
jgi:hypothetical protein